MPVELKGATSGSITLAAPAVAGSNTLTLPAKTGNIITSADSKTITSSMLSSGLILNAATYYDAGSSTTSLTYVSAQGASFNYTPVSNNSTLFILYSYRFGNANVASTNVTGNGRIYETSSSTILSSQVQLGAPSGGGGTAIQSTQSLFCSSANSSLSTRTIVLQHLTSSASSTVTSNLIYCVILEVAN